MGTVWETMTDIGGPMYPPEPSFAPCSGASMPGLRSLDPQIHAIHAYRISENRFIPLTTITNPHALQDRLTPSLHKFTPCFAFSPCLWLRDLTLARRD